VCVWNDVDATQPSVYQAMPKRERKDAAVETRPASVEGKRKKVLVEALPEEERTRRERQKELQRQAVELRSRGEEFVSTKKKRKPLEARKLEKRLAKRKAESAATRRAIQKEAKKQKAAAPDIVVVPIFWKGEAKQMGRVLSACADVESALGKTGKRVLLDAGHKYTPGQKFAHWEYKGVQLRVEVGPREAERGCCTIARTFKPGRPAHRVQRITIDADTLPAELEKLEQLQAPADESDEEAEGRGGADEDAEPAPEQEFEINAAAARATPVSARRGGDDLDDDFDEGVDSVVQVKTGSEAKAAQAKKPGRGRAAGSSVINF
jgi:hypothetical protein